MWLWVVGVSIGLCISIVTTQYREWKESFTGELSEPARAFQFNYLLVYLLANGADWLQGPYVYALYEHYGHDKDKIATLFVAGFISSMLFGTFAGSLADIYGRKRMAIAFGIIYGLSCITKLFSSFWILLLGRFTGGIATSLLFSVFETWMVSEHHRLGFDQNLLNSIFGKSVTLNAMAAIAAGLVASISASFFGFVAPFVVSLIVLIIVTVIIHLHWNENYGDTQTEVTVNLKNAFSAIRSNLSILLLGVIQSLFEGSMYVFVFLWTPTLSAVSESFKPGGSQYLHGLVFSSFMLAIMNGSAVFSKLSKNLTPVALLTRILLCAACTLFVPFVTSNKTLLILSFIAFEFCCGIYFPTVASIRSIIIPEDFRSTIMSIFRVGLNLLVIIALNVTGSLSTSTTFFICTIWLLIASGLTLLFPTILINPAQEKV